MTRHLKLLTYTLSLSTFFFMNSSYAELFISVKNTGQPGFDQVYVHAGIEDLSLKHCAEYTKMEFQKDPSVRMACAEDPENTLFTHRGAGMANPPNGHGKVILSFDPSFPGHVHWCESKMISFTKPVETILLDYPRDFTCN